MPYTNYIIYTQLLVVVDNCVQLDDNQTYALNTMFLPSSTICLVIGEDSKTSPLSPIATTTMVIESGASVPCSDIVKLLGSVAFMKFAPSEPELKLSGFTRSVP